ncbi:MAG: GLPGLI family protein [Bacteroidales bacterium]|jgi:GLPGLI family protein|nr:GLPGLI family protein [Bacteroidales bacterium]
MEKTLLFLIFSFLTLPLIYSQSGGTVSFRPYNKKIPIDSCKYCITYKYEFFTDTLKKIKYYDSKILEIGEKFTRYSSISADKIDSVFFTVQQGKGRKNYKNIAIDGINPVLEAGLNQKEIPMREDVYINYPAKELMTVSINFHSLEYIYKEPVFKFAWKIQSDTTSILGYKCLKATTTFRGRNYEVWFTPFIPIRQGPWKFNGLPGLILKATDTNGYFEWRATGIEKPQNIAIYTYNFEKSSLQETTRENVMRLQHKRWQDPISLMFAGISSLQKVMTVDKNNKLKEIKHGSYQLPYIPIPELE